ncbi:MAG: formate--tetrahydrofolate ligase [Kosmotogaceae bacterium]
MEDIEIAQKATLKSIKEVAKQLDIPESSLTLHGDYIAKVSHRLLEKLKGEKDGKLILVTAMSPTSAGEGKTTNSIGLTMALNKLGKNSMVTLREPSVGPIMGIKGGAAGGGYSQVLPMEDINLHFTGDMHAISLAHNLLSAVIDAHIKFGNELGIDPTRVYWPRAMDMNDRALREIIIGLGGHANGYPREDNFIITAASEIMAILCLATNITDLKERLGNIVIGRNYSRAFIKAESLEINGAMTALLKNALNPNLVQTIEGTPAFVHGGPFANIAHGTNSLMATKMALKLSDYVVTEAGFGAELGGEKFLDFVSQTGDFVPSAVVIVASIRALKSNGGISDKELDNENLQVLEKGFENLRVHYENMSRYNIPVIVALNKFDNDTNNEIEAFRRLCEENNMIFETSGVWEKGSEGGLKLAQKVIDEIETRKEKQFKPLFSLDVPAEEKIEKLAKQIYRASDVNYDSSAKKKLRLFKKHGYGNLPVIVAKTQYSVTDKPGIKGAPGEYTFNIKDLTLSAGAGFIVAVAGSILLMPGLPKVPGATKIDVDEEGTISGLF